jgi:hypothetical protein
VSTKIGFFDRVVGLMRTMQLFRVSAVAVVFFIFVAAGYVSGRSIVAPPVSPNGPQAVLKTTEGLPNKQYARHDIGRIGLLVTNYGTIGQGFVSNPVCDGSPCLSCEFPINSGLEYLFAGALWIGAVKGRDTIVSVGAEGWYANVSQLLPDQGPAGAIIERSNIRTRTAYSPDAVSEQDFISTFADTFVSPNNTGFDQYDNHPHIPLGIAVRQASYAWSYDYAQDFVIFDFKITNVSTFEIKQMYIGWYVDCDVFHKSNSQIGWNDDIAGFRQVVPWPKEYCVQDDSIRLAWLADNDGDPVSDRQWSFFSPTGVTGSTVLRTPNKDLKYSFNWWTSNTDAILDFGPRLAGTDADPFRSFGPQLGTPTGSNNKYYIMSHQEFDYDQLFTAVSHVSQGWLPPPKPEYATVMADGYDARYLLSFGPFNVQPGDTVPITLAYVGGDNFHVAPGDFHNFYDEANPEAYYSKLDFTDIGVNSRWASWIFDNPGYSTLHNADSGKFCWTYKYAPDPNHPGDSILTDSSKLYYQGDGVPDFRGAAPPPAPSLKVIPSYGKMILRWNGQISETSIDVFSGVKTFEGYRIYFGRGNKLTDFVQLAAYDLDDFKIVRFDNILRTWNQIGIPLTRDSLKALYGSQFVPEDFADEFHYFTDPSTRAPMFFVRQDWNASDLTNPLGIHKVYPTASRDNKADTTEEGKLRYYEYEYAVPNLEPSVPYYFAVTAFDFGSLKVGLGSLESSPLVNAIMEYPLSSADSVEATGMKVTVYPNPYRINGGYARAGYENRERTKSAERSRVINFANLPHQCTIRIYSPTGDLVQQIDHNMPEGSAGASHESWNVISRNTQEVVTGIYLWQVSTPMGDQVGKLVIIK